MIRLTVTVAAGLGLLALVSCANLQAPAPERRPWVPEPLVPVASELELEVWVPHGAPTWNEAAVPTTLAGENSAMRTLSAWFLKHDWHYWWSYQLVRSPMTVAYDENRIRVATTISGTLKGWWDTLPGESVAEVEAEAGVEALLGLQSSWSVKATTQTYLEVRHAEVPVGITWDGTFFGETISIAAPVREALRPSLSTLGVTLDAALREWNLKPAVESAWNAGQTSVALACADGAWLALNPQAITTGPLTPRSEALGARLRLAVRPTIGHGPRPNSSLPLPSGGVPTTQKDGSGLLAFELPVDLDWETALKESRPQWLRPQPWTANNGAKIRLTDLAASTEGESVLLRVTAVVLPPWPSAETTAVFWLKGRLASLGGARVAVTGLGLEPTSHAYLAAKAAWLTDPSWLERLADALVWDLSPSVAEATEQVIAQLQEQRMGPHLTLRASGTAMPWGPPRLSENGPRILVRISGPARLTWTP